MQKRTLFISLLMIFTLLLAACGPASDQDATPGGTIFPTDPNTGQPVVPNTGETEMVTPDTGMETAAPTMEAETPTSEATATEAATATTAATNTVEATQQPTRASGSGGGADREGVIGIPQGGGEWLAGLAALYDFNVVDSAGNEIGAVNDFVVNICEANIVYIVVDSADGGQVLVPYQATLETPNNGRVDVENREFVIDLDAADLSGAPSVDISTLDMQDTAWEEETLAFWQADFDIALTTACNVPVSAQGGEAQPTAAATPTLDAGQATLSPTMDADATPSPEAAATLPSGVVRQNIYRIALASRMLGAELQEGNGTRLGTLRDVAIIPETGRTQFLVFEPDADSGNADGSLVPLPPGAVTVEYASGSDEPVFVLLVDTNLFRGAPPFDPDTNMTGDEWFNFWDAHIPMTLDQLP